LYIPTLLDLSSRWLTVWYGCYWLLARRDCCNW